MTLQDFKLIIISVTGLSRDALHIYVGLGVLLLAAFALRRPLRSALPWLITLAVALAVEWVDLRNDLATLGHLRWDESLHDIVNTMFWPTVLSLLARRMPGVDLAQPRASVDDARSPRPDQA
ncbi:MAG TPA: hypothetical protein VLI06_14515 [Solimonas sp.]|nr:hypothetical protein [Solimonas sp.]